MHMSNLGGTVVLGATYFTFALSRVWIKQDQNINISSEGHLKTINYACY